MNDVGDDAPDLQFLPVAEIDGGKLHFCDKIIDILQAKVLFPDKELIIIDFGTATTFDVIKDSVYLGGCIQRNNSKFA